MLGNDSKGGLIINKKKYLINYFFNERMALKVYKLNWYFFIKIFNY